jgi:menaquinone-dependent protoporphyrinogen IX oxidase
MTAGKTLVAYVTKGGATKEAADLIAETLREKYGLEVDVVDLKKQKHPDITPYENIIVGGGVRTGGIYGEAVEFMKQDFKGKRVAVFICAALSKNPVKMNKLAERYITEGVASKTSLVSREAFGGCIKLFGKAIADGRDPARIRAWTEELGKKFTEQVGEKC